MKDEAGINDLKFVCRQLRAETRGLEVEINELIFLKDKNRARIPTAHACDDHVDSDTKPGIENTEYISKNPSIQLLGFLDMCSESWRQRLRLIRLRRTKFDIFDLENNYFVDFHAIVYYCQRYPKLTVLWQAEIFSKIHETMDCFLNSRPYPSKIVPIKEPAIFLSHGIMWLFAFRGITQADILKKELDLPDNVKHIYILGWQKVMRMRWRANCEHRPRCLDCHVSARNFRFVPVEDEHQWHVRFRRWLMECGIEREPAIIDKYVAVAKDWVQNGM
jgi:hypothetical protein